MAAAANLIRRKCGVACSVGDILLYGPRDSRGIIGVRRDIGKRREERRFWLSGGLPQIPYGCRAGAGCISIEDRRGYHSLFVCPKRSFIIVFVSGQVGERILDCGFRAAICSPEERQDLCIGAGRTGREGCFGCSGRDFLFDR